MNVADLLFDCCKQGDQVTTVDETTNIGVLRLNRHSSATDKQET